MASSIRGFASALGNNPSSSFAPFGTVPHCRVFSRQRQLLLERTMYRSKGSRAAEQALLTKKLLRRLIASEASIAVTERHAVSRR